MIEPPVRHSASWIALHLDVGFAPSESQRHKFEACADASVLMRWKERAVYADSLEDALDDRELRSAVGRPPIGRRRHDDALHRRAREHAAECLADRRRNTSTPFPAAYWDVRIEEIAEYFQQGWLNGRRESLFTVLEARGLMITPQERALVLASDDAEQLTGWVQRASIAASMGEVLDG